MSEPRVKMRWPIPFQKNGTLTVNRRCRYVGLQWLPYPGSPTEKELDPQVEANDVPIGTGDLIPPGAIVSVSVRMLGPAIMAPALLVEEE